MIADSVRVGKLHFRLEIEAGPVGTRLVISPGQSGHGSACPLRETGELPVGQQTELVDVQHPLNHSGSAPIVERIAELAIPPLDELVDCEIPPMGINIGLGLEIGDLREAPLTKATN